MIYLDNGATSFEKPPEVWQAMRQAMFTCASPGRGGYTAAMNAARTVYRCRKTAGEMFECGEEQVVFTANCTHGLNIAIRTLVQPGDRVLITGFEHNAVTRTLWDLGAEITVAGRKLFDPEDTLKAWREALKKEPKVAVMTHVSNVFGYILPVFEMAQACRKAGIPFVIDAAQSAGILPVSLRKFKANYIAMAGHKGLLGPQGTGILLCRDIPRPLITGGTGSDSIRQQMPEDLPEGAEAGTMNVPGIAGLAAGMAYLCRYGIENIFRQERRMQVICGEQLQTLGMEVFQGKNQAGTLSFRPGCGCEEAAEILAQQGIAVRAGLHCAPLAHESAGTAETGTVRVSFGHLADLTQIEALLKAAAKLPPRKS